MRERDIEKIIGDERMATTLFKEVESPSKDILQDAVSNEQRDEDYIGEIVRVDDRGRMEDARVVRIIDWKFWEVEILKTKKYIEVRKYDIELPKSKKRRKDVIGMMVTVIDRRGNKQRGTIERDNKDGTYEVEYKDGRCDRDVPERDIEFEEETAGEGKCEALYRGKWYPGVVVKTSRNKDSFIVKLDGFDREYELPRDDVKLKSGRGGSGLYDITIDEMEGIDLDLGGSYIQGNPCIRIKCGSVRKEAVGRGSNPKFDKRLQFTRLDMDKIQEIVFELHSHGILRTTKVASAIVDSRDILDKNRREEEVVFKSDSSNRRKGVLRFTISCKSTGGGAGSPRGRDEGQRGGGAEIGRNRKGVTPLAIYTIKKTDLIISDGDLIDYSGDAIVNCCDPECVGRSGLKLDKDLNEEGGRDFRNDREDLKSDRRGDRCPVGSAVVTRGGKLRAKYVIHAAAPELSKSSRGSRDEDKQLERLYKEIIEKADDSNCRDIAIGMLPPEKWQGGRSMADVAKIALDTLKYELDGRVSVEEVHLVATNRDEKRALESEAEHILRDFKKKSRGGGGRGRGDIFDVRTKDGFLQNRDFMDLMKDVGLSNKEGTILFDYYDKEGEGKGDIKFEDFLNDNPFISDNRKDLNRICDKLIDKTKSILENNRKYENEEVDAKWKEKERGLEGWLRATIMRANDDGTFEVEYDERDRSNRRLLWEDCPRSKIRFPRARVTVVVKKGSSFPRSGFFKSKLSHSVHLYGGDSKTQLARTKAQAGSDPNFKETVFFFCDRDQYKDIRVEVHDDKGNEVMSGYFPLGDGRRSLFDVAGRPRTESVKLKASKHSGEPAELVMTVVCAKSVSVRTAFDNMEDRGEVDFNAMLKFISDRHLGVDEYVVKDLFDTLDRRHGNIITRKDFTSWNPSSTSEDKDFVDAILSITDSRASGATSSVSLTVIEASDLPERCDAFVKISCGDKSFRTKIVRKDKNPCWDEKFSFNCAPESFSKMIFTIMRDSDHYAKDIGEAIVVMKTRHENLWEAAARRPVKDRAEIIGRSKSSCGWLHYELELRSMGGERGEGGRDDVKRWSERDVEDWLDKKGWSKYSREFKRVDGSKLLSLSVVDLENMRVDRRDTHDMQRDIDALKRSARSSEGKLPSKWDVREVSDWVAKQGFKREARTFEDKRIDGRALFKLSLRKLEDDLRMDRRDARDLMASIEGLARELDERNNERDRNRKDDRDRRDDKDRRSDRDSNRDRRDGRGKDPPKPIEIVFQFGERNTKSTRRMKCELSETPLVICEKIHQEYLKGVKADDMELVYKTEPLHPTNRTIGEIGVKEKDRIIIRRARKRADDR